MSSYGSYYAPRGSMMDAYRASPMLHRQEGNGSGGRGGGSGGARGGRWSAGGSNWGSRNSAEGHHGPEIYGFDHAAGLPGFEGRVAAATLAAHGTPCAAPEAAYLALLCHEGLSDFRQAHSWNPGVVPGVETVLRSMAQQCTPSGREMQIRLHAMARLKELAQSGIHFCQGLDLEPYGSFVSGLYTPTGDLDLSIEGHATWRDEAGQVQRITVDGMEREMKVKFLRALASRIQAKRISQGQVERILHARVPILKFRDSSGLDFDVGIGGSHALFKSTVLGLLAQYEWRFGALVRLVKLWSRHYDVNDSTNGTFNSFALTMLVVFHLQTRSPAVLPPLCQLFGQASGSARPMQEGQFPDWHLLTLACDHLSHLSRQGGLSPAGGNSETLLELLSSFFALYEGLLTGGWAAPKGADADALRGVLRRVRVDTWGGRLRYERWDKEGYCCSIEDPFDSTDNCARTVRHEDKVARIHEAVAAGRQLLLELEQPHQAEAALEQLFGPSALHRAHLRDLLFSNGHTSAVQWIPPVDLIIPPRIQAHTQAHIPRTVHVHHQRPRGAGAPQQSRELAEVQHQLGLLTLSSQSSQQQQQQQFASTLPPPGLGHAPPPLPPLAAAGLAPEAAVPGIGVGASGAMLQQSQPAGLMMSLQGLRQAMESEVAEEAARLAELERKAAEAAALVAAAREERKAAKRAAAKAAREAKAEERRRQRADRGRSRSRSRGWSQGNSSRSRSSSSKGSQSQQLNGGSDLSPALAAAMSAAAAAVSNRGQAAHMASSSAGDAAAAAGMQAAAPQAGAAAAATEELPSEAAAPTSLHPAALIDASASEGPFSCSGIEDATQPAAGPAASGAAWVAEGAAEADLGGADAGAGGSSFGVQHKEKRYGKNMKAAARERKQRRAAANNSGSVEHAAGAPPPGLSAVQQQQARVAPPAPAQQQQQQQFGPDGSARPQSRGRRRGQQQRSAAAVGDVASGGVQADHGTRVLRVPLRQGGRGGRGGPGAAAAAAAVHASI